MVEKTPQHDFWYGVFFRYVLVYISFAIGATLFSNWRFFPSVDLTVFPENWGKFIFYTFWIGVPYLLISYLFAFFLRTRFEMRWKGLVDLLFVALFLVGPISFFFSLLQSFGRSTFSFGVSEGEIIKNGIVTELGKKYFWMQKMMEVFHMVIFLALRVFASFTPIGRFMR